MPARLKLLRGNPGRRPVRAIFEPPLPPSFLTGYALEEWERVAPAFAFSGS
jgi:hypothetical protein